MKSRSFRFFILYFASIMIKPSRLFACLSWLLLWLPASHANGETYMAVESNVSYGSVTTLEYAHADLKLVYGDADPDLQYGLLWLPRHLDATGKTPLIILIHGGCWLNAYDIQHSFPLSTALADAGYAVWSLEYRRSGDAGGGWPGTFEDIRQGIAYTSRLENYPLDPDRMVIMGHSAGGHLALLASAEFKNIEAVIGLAAITDIVEYSRGENSCQAATIDFMGGTYEADPAAYHAANPVDKSMHDHTILLQGDIDTIVPPGQSQIAGVTTVLVEGAGHFDWLHPGTPAFRKLLSTLGELSQK
jgi:acetyl esterase/lipase